MKDKMIFIVSTKLHVCFCIVLVVCIIFSALGCSKVYMSSPIITDNLRANSSTFINKLGIGATHTEQESVGGGDARATASAKQLMQTSLTYQNVQIMGWGVGDPEPSPGVYNWSDLDFRVQLMRDTKAQMVLSLCCVPGWMRPLGRQNDWKYLEVAPDPSHVQDFAHLAQQVALRYPGVRYFQVWNELKGMWSTDPGATPGISQLNRWDYERYTTLYNAVYDAIKSVRPDAQIGGPYVVLDSNGGGGIPGPSYSWGTLDQRDLDVITYWLAHKHGADFIALDAASGNKDGVWLTDPFSALQKFVDITTWLRAQPNGGATLPLWWAEWYVGYPLFAPHDLGYYNALMTAGEIETAISGASVLLIWQPQGNASGFSLPEGVWTDANIKGGGQPTEQYTILAAFKAYFSPGTQLYIPRLSISTITVIASDYKMMIVNHLGIQQEVVIDRSTIILSPYQVIFT